MGTSLPKGWEIETLGENSIIVSDSDNNVQFLNKGLPGSGAESMFFDLANHLLTNKESDIEPDKDTAQLRRILASMANDLGTICEMLGADAGDDAVSVVRNYIRETKAMK